MASGEVKKFFRAAGRGIDWIAREQRADGSFCDPEEGVGAYYKVPYALSLAGRSREAQRLAQWIGEHNCTPEGDFRGTQRKANDPVHDSWPVYSNAWLVQGLHRLGRWDLSGRGTQFLLRYQTPSGGFYALDGNKRFLEPVCTSWAGLAVLRTGNLDAACRAGGLLVGLVGAQKDPERFYFRMDLGGKPVTNVPAGGDLNYYVDSTQTKQIYFNPGIALIFLCHLYRATGKEKYLDAGKEIFRFTERCAKDVYAFPPSGKLGSGCALLYALSGDADARRAAVAVGKYLVKTQTADGFWRLPDEEPYLALKERDNFDIRLDVTAEFVTFLMEIASLI